MKTYRINEIFYSIQGEGLYVGTPMVFVRFAGCNLNCDFCDTAHEEWEAMTGGEILQRIKACQPPGALPVDVCLTGGEPTLQIDEGLMDNLQYKWGDPSGAFHTLHLETNGTIDIIQPERFQCITISPKVRASAVELAPLRNAMTFGRLHGEVVLKLLYDVRESTSPTFHEMQRGWSLALPWDVRYIQPITASDGSTNVQEAAQFVRDNPDWRLSVQMHKLLNLR